MFSPDDLTYALENTRIVQMPHRRLESFGATLLNYHLITEEMDAVHQCNIREGQILAQRPQILTPSGFAKLMLEGFGEKAEEFAHFLNQHEHHLSPFLRYGFEVKKSEILSYELHGSLEAAVDQVRQVVDKKNDPFAIILTGVDDSWEVSLLKLMVEMVAHAGPMHFKDFKNRGLF